MNSAFIFQITSIQKIQELKFYYINSVTDMTDVTLI